MSDWIACVVKTAKLHKTRPEMACRDRTKTGLNFDAQISIAWIIFIAEDRLCSCNRSMAERQITYRVEWTLYQRQTRRWNVEPTLNDHPSQHWANTCPFNVGLSLGHRLRRWPNLKPTLAGHLVIAGMMFVDMSDSWLTIHQVGPGPQASRQSRAADGTSVEPALGWGTVFAGTYICTFTC